MTKCFVVPTRIFSSFEMFMSSSVCASRPSLDRSSWTSDERSALLVV